MKKEVKILMDEKRNLYIKDEDGVEYSFWPLGYGIPVAFQIYTKKEQEEQKKQTERIEKEYREKRDRELLERKKPWWKLF